MFWKQWIRHPQSLWIRRVFFQIHLWLGIGIGIYVLAISISGSALVYRRELNRGVLHRIVVAGQPHSVNRLFGWLADLHDNLLFGLMGRTLNGIGAFLVVLLSLTGMMVWWPGIKNWRRSMTIKSGTSFARFNWDLHSAVGFWCSLLVMIWGISGFCLCFPGTLDFVLGHQIRYWLTSLHFGRFNGITEALWTILGLAPAFLAGTGALMWWNRVLSKKI